MRLREGRPLGRRAARIAAVEFRPLLELLIDQVAYRLDDPDVGFCRAATDVPGFPGRGGTQNEVDRPAVIVDVEPVPDLHSIAVDRQWPSFEDVHDAERQELLGKLVRPVVVRAVADRARRPVGVDIGTHDVVGRRFAGGVRVSSVRRPYSR